MSLSQHDKLPVHIDYQYMYYFLDVFCPPILPNDPKIWKVGVKNDPLSFNPGLNTA